MHTTQNGDNKTKNYRMKIETSLDFAIDVIDVIPYAVVLNECNSVETAVFFTRSLHSSALISKPISFQFQVVLCVCVGYIWSQLVSLERWWHCIRRLLVALTHRRDL